MVAWGWPALQPKWLVVFLLRLDLVGRLHKYYIILSSVLEVMYTLPYTRICLCVLSQKGEAMLFRNL